ncbi:MAG: hypothetical protein ACOYLC_09295, partial [Armatimonadaceae bacterium]
FVGRVGIAVGFQACKTSDYLATRAPTILWHPFLDGAAGPSKKKETNEKPPCKSQSGFQTN